MTKNSRHYSFLDRICINADQVLRTLYGCPLTTERKNPAATLQQPMLTSAEQQLSAGLMRVNHTGEVCAQALYLGQALTARTPSLRAHMQSASLEENDHLAWCADRLKDLKSHTSYLNPLWYAGSFTLGIIAGVIGDAWNLGFLAETEHQVVAHLESHLQCLPKNDIHSYAIIQQMIIDEHQHETSAIAGGAKTLPESIKNSMRLASKIMTTVARWV